MAADDKPQPLQVSPEFAGGGLAGVLGRTTTAQPAPAGTGQPDPSDWVVFGVDTIAQMAAENAARAAGQTVGQWLSALIAEAASAEK